MVARTQLAILDHNANVGRKQAEIKRDQTKERRDLRLFVANREKIGWPRKLKCQKHTPMLKG